MAVVVAVHMAADNPAVHTVAVLVASSGLLPADTDLVQTVWADIDFDCIGWADIDFAGTGYERTDPVERLPAEKEDIAEPAAAVAAPSAVLVAALAAVEPMPAVELVAVVAAPSAVLASVVEPVPAVAALLYRIQSKIKNQLEAQLHIDYILKAYHPFYQPPVK